MARKPNAQPPSKTTSTTKTDATGTMPDEENAAATDFKKRVAEAMDFIISKSLISICFLYLLKITPVRCGSRLLHLSIIPLKN